MFAISRKGCGVQVVYFFAQKQKMLCFFALGQNCHHAATPLYSRDRRTGPCRENGLSDRAVECKTTELRASPALRYFGERLNIPYLYQVHLEGQEDILDGRVRVMPAAKFLAGLP
jgi:hypothetical protein